MDLNLGRVLLVIIFVLGCMVAFWPPVSATYTPHLESTTPTTLDGMRATSDDIDERVEPGHKIFTLRSNYYSFAERDHAYTSRIWFLASPYSGQKLNWENVTRAEPVRENLTRMMSDGDIQLVIMTPRTGYLIQYWPLVDAAFADNFCRVEPQPDLYEQYGVHLYEYHGQQPQDCTSEIEIEWTG
jgi:hypothetical protein